MKEFVFHFVEDDTYIGIFSVLDYEFRLKPCLEGISFPSRVGKQKIIVDLALKCGVNEYRFAEFDVSVGGKILWNTWKYVVPSNNILHTANTYLREHGEIVLNSMLPSTEKKEILGGLFET